MYEYVCEYGGGMMPASDSRTLTPTLTRKSPVPALGRLGIGSMMREVVRTYRGLPAAWLAVACLLAGISGIAAAQDSSAAPIGPASQLIPIPFDSASRTPSSGIRMAPKRLTDYDVPGLKAKVGADLKTLQPWDVVQVIEFLAYRSGLSNFVIGKGVAGLTTKLRFEENVTVGEALEVVLSVNRLAYEVKNNIITILTDAEYEAINGSSFYDNKQVHVESLMYADPSHVATILAPLKSTIGTVVSDTVTGTLILIDTPDKIREMLSVVRGADIKTVSRQVPTETRTFVLQYAQVEDLQAELSGLLTKPTGALYADARTKSLIVTDLPHSMRRIENMIDIFDRPQKQVFIEAKIVEVSLNDEYRMGINWDHLFEGLDPRVSLKSAVSRPAAAAGAGLGSLTYKTIVGGGDLTVVVDALKTIGKTKILSNPHVAVMSDEEATIKVIRDQPYAEAQIESGTTNVIGETIKFIEVGVKLDVTPRVNDSGFISMAIKPEVSTVVDEYQATRVIPVVQRAFAETTVMARDGETIIIAGMIRNEKSEGTGRVPWLGSIPLLGMLFRSDTESLVTSETVVFLTPRIVGGDRPYRLLKDEEKKLKPLRTRPTGRGETVMQGLPGED